jgi:hypothetical protein
VASEQRGLAYRWRVAPSNYGEKKGAVENSPGLSTAESAAKEVALGGGLTGGDVERVLQCLDAGGFHHPLGVSSTGRWTLSSRPPLPPMRPPPIPARPPGKAIAVNRSGDACT